MLLDNVTASPSEVKTIPEKDLSFCLIENIAFLVSLILFINAVFSSMYIFSCFD
jgi:hypothetical protein